MPFQIITEDNLECPVLSIVNLIQRGFGIHVMNCVKGGCAGPVPSLMVDSIAARFRNIFKKSSESAPEINPDEATADTPQVEPVSLALQIQSLIEQLPSPSSASNSVPSQDGHQPMPSPSPHDSGIMRVLSDAAIMNGSRGTNNARPSIWSILERLRSPKRDRNPAESYSGAHLTDDDASDLFSDSSSVMLYSPLLPARGSLVELADSEVTVEVVEEVGEDEEEGEEVGGPELLQSQPPIPGWTWANILPVFDWFNQPAQPTSSEDNNPPLTPRTRERQLRAQASRIWIPSKDQLSIQCLWWGYRMFLPPPVLDILNDRQLEAARRTVMITTALTWFFDNLPIDSLPPPLRPTLLLIKHIAPYLGCIGTFISWSWGTMASYDQGYGITLTATWIVPFALIPGTWFERDWPTSPPQSPQSLPGTSSPQTGSQPEALSTTLVYTMTPPASPQLPLPASPQPPSPAVSPAQMSMAPLSPEINIAPPQPDYEPSIPPSSPALSFVTAPSSPLPMSPKRNPLSLAGLVAKSPLIRVRRIRSKQNLNNNTPLKSTHHHSPSPLSQSHSQLDLESHNSSGDPLLSPRTTYPTISHFSSSSAVASPLITPHPLNAYPSPPADPNDLRLLQSPIWECSPLPSEHLPQPALLPSISEVRVPKEPKASSRTKRLFPRRQS